MTSNYSQLKSALIGRFFVISGLLFVSADVFSAAEIQQDPACQASLYHETARVNYVIDGDTIILSDKRHIRLIGINTPEIGHEERPSDAGAVVARAYLRKLLQKDTVIYLFYDEQRHDRHRRTLAHIFLKDGTNIQARLLREGIAFPLTIPPNLSFLDCYQSNAHAAYDQNKGVWGLADFQPIPVAELSSEDSGYRIITGKVARVEDSTSALWINLEPNTVLRIKHEDLTYFEIKNLRNLIGKNIRALGWLRYVNGKYRMQIHHPVHLVILPH